MIDRYETIRREFECNGFERVYVSHYSEENRIPRRMGLSRSDTVKQLELQLDSSVIKPGAVSFKLLATRQTIRSAGKRYIYTNQ